MKIKDLIPETIDLTGKVLLDEDGNIYLWAQVDAGMFCFICLDINKERINNRLVDPVKYFYTLRNVVPLSLIKEQFKLLEIDYLTLSVLTLDEAVIRKGNIKKYGTHMVEFD